jgi:hypothetical protein
MLRNVLICSILSLASLTAQTTIVSQTGAALSGFNTTSYASWTQTSAFSGVSIFGFFVNQNPSGAGAAATGTAYLTTQVGAGTTVAQQIATAPISTTATVGTSTQLFSGLNLPAGTYFLVVSPTAGVAGPNTLNWSTNFNVNGVTVTTAAGVTANPDFQLFGVAAAYPPASTFNSNKGKILLYSVLAGVAGAVTAAAGAPLLTGWGMLILAVLLGLSGMWLVRKHAHN